MASLGKTCLLLTACFRRKFTTLEVHHFVNDWLKETRTRGCKNWATGNSSFLPLLSFTLAKMLFTLG